MIIVIYHSVLGVRFGEKSTAGYLADCGHETRVVDQYDGQVFDDFQTAEEYALTLGSRKLHQRANEAVTDLRDPFVVAGFSMGGAMAIGVATSHSAVCGLVLYAGVGDTATMGIQTWPASVPVQVHYTPADPTPNYDWIDRFESLVRASDASYESIEYPGSGHLFTERALPDQYQPDDARALWASSARLIADLGDAGFAPH